MDISQLLKSTGFEWDEGNIDKNWIRHGVSPSECEQIFLNQPLVVADDVTHSDEEARWYALGRTDANRLLFVVFAIRKDRIRVVSARDMSLRERKVYQQYENQ